MYFSHKNISPVLCILVTKNISHVLCTLVTKNISPVLCILCHIIVILCVNYTNFRNMQLRRDTFYGYLN